jgi:hypothetical protein
MAGLLVDDSEVTKPSGREGRRACGAAWSLLWEEEVTKGGGSVRAGWASGRSEETGPDLAVAEGGARASTGALCDRGGRR